MNNLSIGKRIAILMIVSATLLLLLAGISWKNQSSAVSALKSVHEDRAVPLADLGKISVLLGENIAELLLVVQHDPSSLLAKAHDHPISLHVDKFDERRKQINALWNNYMVTNHTPEEEALAEEAEEKRMRWADKATGLMKRMNEGEFTVGLMREILAARANEGAEANHVMDRLIDLQAKLAQQEYQKEMAATQDGTLWFAVIILGGLAGLAGFAWLTTRSITGPINDSVAAAEAIAGGDLTRPLPTGGRDEAGRLLAAFGHMQSGLREMVRGTQQNAHELAGAAESLSQAARHAETAATEQSDAASDMAASVQEMSVSIDQVRDHAREARGIAENAGASSRTGGTVVHSSAEEMRQVAAAVNEAAGTIRDLENYSKEISAVINVIREVADQTNLLALNAAIEAARAGEQGRGFAVVADEVRKLAERTSESTHTIGSVIEKVQAGASRAAQEIENSVTRVEGGVKLAHDAGNSITGIQSDSEKVVATVTDIGTALDEQSSATQVIARGVERIAGMAEENSASVRQTAAAAQRLHELAGALEGAVARFRV